MGVRSKVIIALIVIILLGAVEWYFASRYFKPRDSSVLIEKIDDLEKQLEELSAKKDSVRLVIDTIDRQIVTNNHYYEERINSIITQPDSITDIFTRQYLREFADSLGFIMQ